MSSIAEAVSDGRVVAWRNLKRIPRIPELAIFAVLQSIMFVACSRSCSAARSRSRAGAATGST